MTKSKADSACLLFLCTNWIVYAIFDVMFYWLKHDRFDNFVSKKLTNKASPYMKLKTSRTTFSKLRGNQEEANTTTIDTNNECVRACFFIFSCNREFWSAKASSLTPLLTGCKVDFLRFFSNLSWFLLFLSLEISELVSKSWRFSLSPLKMDHCHITKL